jgi:hypothetical protein
MRTDRQTDNTKLIVAFRNFANAPKKERLTQNADYKIQKAIESSDGRCAETNRQEGRGSINNGKGKAIPIHT